MPVVSIATSYNKSINDITILANYINSSIGLDAKFQHMIGEVIMLRLFSTLESTISEVALKLACGAKYRNGNSPLVIHNCTSVQDAYSNMLTYNRRRALRYLQWTKASFIRDSIEHILDVSDAFYFNIQSHGLLINEMRIVRNHIAHRSSSTASDYTQLLRQKYGGNPRLTLGAYLTSTNRHPTSNIKTYIQSTRIIVNDITNG